MNTITVNKIDIVIKIKKVFVERCCGTWCVKIEDFSGATFRVAAIEDDYFSDGAVKAAKKYAEKIAKIFGAETEVEE